MRTTYGNGATHAAARTMAAVKTIARLFPPFWVMFPTRLPRRALFITALFPTVVILTFGVLVITGFQRNTVLLVGLGTGVGVIFSATTALVLMRHASSLERLKSDLEQRTARLQTAAEEWHLLFDGIDSPIVVLDDQGIILRLNKSARDLAGKPFDQVIGSHVTAIGPERLWRTAAQLSALVGAGQAPVEEVIEETDERRVWEVRAMPFAWSDGRPGRTILKARDITEVSALESSLRISEKLSAIGMVTAGVAHEVRNPLFGISALLDALDAARGDDVELKPYATRLRQQVNRLRDLMADLLEYGRVSRADSDATPVHCLIEAAIGHCRALAESQDVRIDAELQNTSAILGDRVRLELIFRNLLENALQHSPRGSAVEVGVGPGGSASEWIEVRVRDHGPGFTPSDLPHVFEPFFTKRRGGSGLGLAIAQRIIVEHGGEVRAGNHPEGGAQLSVLLRVAPHEAPVLAEAYA